MIINSSLYSTTNYHSLNSNITSEELLHHSNAIERKNLGITINIFHFFLNINPILKLTELMLVVHDRSWQKVMPEVESVIMKLASLILITRSVSSSSLFFPKSSPILLLLRGYVFTRPVYKNGRV